MPKVRVDFFKRSGKWYTTEEMEWSSLNPNIQLGFAESLYNHLKRDLGTRLDDMIAICLEPAHINAFPLMMPVEDIFSHLKVDGSGEAPDPEDDSDEAMLYGMYEFPGI